MERQKPTTQVQYNDAFSQALIGSAARYLGEESIPSLEKKTDLDDFSKKDPKEKAAPADPAIVLATGSGPKQSHGAEIKYTNVVKKEEIELMPDELVGTTYEAVLETGETIIIEKEKGLDGKACWKGYKQMGTKKKGGKTVDNCVKAGYEPEGDTIQEKKDMPGNQEKIDANKNGKVDAHDFELLRAKKGKKSVKEQVTLSDIVEKAVGNSKEKFLNMIKDKKKGDVKDGSEKDDKATASVTSKDTEKFVSAKKKEVKEGMDPVGKEDSDVNNDGKSDKQDKFLKGRRDKVSKIVAAKKKVDEMIALEQEIINEKKQ
jgi:hypothetical protein